MTDFELLQQYVADRAAHDPHDAHVAHDAFAELVRRHVDHVYTAALRQTARDSDAAEEVTQRVFILLASKAKTLVRDPHVLLGGWLFNAVRYIAKDVQRKQQRRTRHEQKAAEMADMSRNASARHAAAHPHDPEWKEVEAELDDAMSHLAEPTRGVLVLRFFEGKTSREVGQHLGISEEAARKRVSRAVDELRELFLRRGIVMSATGLSEGLAAIALTKAPEGLAASAASAATSAAVTTTSTAATVTGGVLMASAKAKTAALVAAVVLLTGGAVTVGPKFFAPTRARTVTLAKTGPTITGTVFGPDGKPLAGAEVRVASPDKQVAAYTGPRDRADGLTDANGKYAVPKPTDDHYVIVVSAPQGYAQVSWKQLARGEQIKLEPWGRIEGIAYHAGKPQPKASVHLWRVGENNEPVSHQTTVTADANGHYVIPRVAPGGVQIYRNLTPRMWRSTDWQYVEVPAGKTVNVPIGGRGGASVVGRIAVPPDMTKFIAWKDSGTYTYEANVRLELSEKRPAHAKDEAPEEYRAIEEAFARTPEGRKYKEWVFGRNFEVNPDGTFRIDELPPGKYTATIRHFEEQPQVNFMEDVARTEVKFEIPAPSATQPTFSAAQPIDVGTAVPESLHRLRPGDAAPDINVTTLDGDPWRLADHKGKVFVLVCWGAYGDRMETESFTQLAAKYGNDPRVAILGCVATDSADQARGYIKKLNFTFPNTSDIKLMTTYDNSWPSAVIVGRDGKILQKHLSNESLKKYLAIALGEAPPATAPTGRRRR